MDGRLSWPALSYVRSNQKVPGRDTSYGGCERQMELHGCTVLLVACRPASGVPASNGMVQGHPHYSVLLEDAPPGGVNRIGWSALILYSYSGRCRPRTHLSSRQRLALAGMTGTNPRVAIISPPPPGVRQGVSVNVTGLCGQPLCARCSRKGSRQVRDSVTP